MKLLKIFLFFIILTSLLYSFYIINGKNYQMHRIFLMNVVNHPEFIPDSKIAKITAFWFKQVNADFYWLKSIQYIGSNAISAEYKKYLYSMINLITDLSPNFEKPYVIWTLLLPDYNYRYEKGSENEKNINLNIKQWEQIWLKWIENFCDKKKLDLIKNEYNLIKIKTEEKYKNPCYSYQIPYNLAYVKFFYQNDWEKSSFYYKITSAIEKSPTGSTILAAIMQWKWWNREKSIIMFLNMINTKNLKWDEIGIYKAFATKINQILKWETPLNKQNLAILNTTLNKIFPKIEGEKEKNVLLETDLKNYLRKAIRELNLFYVEKANEKFVKDNKKNAKSARELFDKKYLDYFPIDFQQYDDYGIAYVYDEKIKKFNNEMRQYTDEYFLGILEAKKK